LGPRYTVAWKRWVSPVASDARAHPMEAPYTLPSGSCPGAAMRSSAKSRQRASPLPRG
jgi:hypothetical protein